MILGGSMALIIPSLIASGILYSMLSRSLLDISRERTVQAARDLAALVDTSLRQELYHVSTIALDPVIVQAARSGEYTAAARKLTAIHAGLPSPNYTYLLADGQGIVRADAVFQDSIGLDIHDRPYFIAAKAGTASIFGPVRARVPQGSPRTSETVVFACAPVRDASGFCGLLAAVIHIDRFLEVATSIRIGTTGYAFLVDAAGLVLLHPDDTLILAANLYDAPGMEVLAGRLSRGETGSEACVLDGVERIVGFAPIEVSGWRVVIAQDRSEVLAPINRILLVILLVAIVVLALTIGIIATLSRRISTPIERTMDLLRRITAQSEDVILIIGRDRRIMDANPAAEKILGFGSGSIVGTEPVLKNLQNVPAREIWKGLEAGRTWTGALQVARDGSTARTYTAIILPVKDRAGAIQSYIEIAKDVTNELQLEARLRQSQKMEALGAMAGGIAHDFNNILGGIFGFSELALTEKENPGQTEECIREIMQAAERARDLTRQILTFSRGTGLDLHVVSLKSLVAEALKLVRASVPATIEIRADLQSDECILAEPTQIHQVIMNLCTNAVAALEGRAGLIEVGIEDRDVDEEHARLHPGLRPGRHVLLRVSDSGKGIEPSIIERIFEPFFTTKPQGQGTGLGLSVVHGILRRLNGFIGVHSELGKGTTFDVLIPAVPAAADEARRPITAPAGGTERVLLVDDELPIVRSISPGLATLGYAITTFTDSRQALEAFTRDPGAFDVLVTDNLMPHMTGFQLARGIHGLRAGLPVVLCSGYFSREAEEEARSEGIRELLTKPLNSYQVAAAIRKAVADGAAGERSSSRTTRHDSLGVS
jgi:PAS domain S-box-containing protein